MGTALQIPIPHQTTWKRVWAWVITGIFVVQRLVKGFSTSWHGSAHGFVVFVWSSPSHCPLFDMRCSQVCPEADKAKGREGLSWHEALATFGPKKVLFSQFFTRLWGMLGSQKLHLVKLSYCSKGKAGGEMFLQSCPQERERSRGNGDTQSFPSRALSLHPGCRNQGRALALLQWQEISPVALAAQSRHSTITVSDIIQILISISTNSGAGTIWGDSSKATLHIWAGDETTAWITPNPEASQLPGLKFTTFYPNIPIQKHTCKYSHCCNFLWEQITRESSSKGTEIRCKMTPLVIEFLCSFLLKKYAFRGVQWMGMRSLCGQCLWIDG